MLIAMFLAKSATTIVTKFREQRARVGARPAVALNPSPRQQHRSGGQLERFVARVRAHQNRAPLAAEALEHYAKPRETLSIEPGCRFIKQ